ncbi:MAG: hypothetical protein ACKOHM_06270 [Spartobacteria bacterium]
MKSDTNQSLGTFSEASRSTPVVNQSDVMICGGGPAGVAAAIATNRHAAKVALGLK